MRKMRREIEEILRKMEDKHNLNKNVLSQIYDEEANVVFMGKRRNILKRVRRIAIQARRRKSETAETGA